MRDGSLIALLALGAFHGLNPGMGWLFAVARGLQERSRALVLQALPAIAAGHAASIFVVAVVVTVTGSVLTSRVVSIAGGVVLVGFGLWRLLSKRHFRWVGMRLTLWQLAGWSFLMSSAHGAGLMLVPVLTHGSIPVPHSHAHGVASSAGDAVSAAVFVTLVHTFAMFAVAGTIAVLVYEVVGLAVLRRAWFNLDRLWAAALIAAGATTLLITA
jgi:multisubunit Na+/H+ antiporter MnhC subunit